MNAIILDHIQNSKHFHFSKNLREQKRIAMQAYKGNDADKSHTTLVVYNQTTSKRAIIFQFGLSTSESEEHFTNGYLGNEKC